jgi:methylmalonyl-CoA/ethylmalonyl-CoA epimerase
MNERTLDHVGIAVASLDEAIPLWEGLLSANATGREVVTSQSVEVAFFETGSASVELLAPLRPNSPVAQFLERRGAGIHHLAFRVPDLAAAMESLADEGFTLVDEYPREGAHGRRIAFLHPRTAGGVLVELVEDAG